jgi:hypothetical protein
MGGGKLAVEQFDTGAVLRRPLAIPQTRDRRYHIKLCHYPELARLTPKEIVRQLLPTSKSPP